MEIVRFLGAAAVATLPWCVGCGGASVQSEGQVPIGMSPAPGGVSAGGAIAPPGGEPGSPGVAPTGQGEIPNVVVAPPGGSRVAREGLDAEHPVMRCGPRDSYYYVATLFRCADGSNPLGGNVAAGSHARRGNVGANSTGHIIDLYAVPCPEGAQEVYVDMYGCPGG